jgi:phage tail sheath protein FI
MPEYRHPGVYIGEIELGPRPIEGVPTSTAAFLGEAERGAITPAQQTHVVRCVVHWRRHRPTLHVV